MDAYKKYKTTSVQSASKERLLLMLYEAAIKFVKKAIIAAEAKNVAERGVNIGKAFDIVLELQNTLDHKIGGDIAKNLDQLYGYVIDQLTQANVKGDVAPLKNCVRILEVLNDGWKKAIEQLKKGHPPQTSVKDEEI